MLREAGETAVTSFPNDALSMRLPDTAGLTPTVWLPARYDLVDRLGEGSIGVVYRAYDRFEERMVALKTVREPQPESLSELKAEFRARRELLHPNLLPLFDLVATSDGAYFTMQLVQGPSLQEWIRLGGNRSGDASSRVAPRVPAAPLAPEQLARLLSAVWQALAGINAMHEVGFVHRDIKPQNLLVDHRGHLFVGDFGLALSWEQQMAPERALRIGGTLGYIAPECLRGDRPSPASDLYALGVVIKEMLTARPVDPAQWRIDPSLPDWIDRRLAALVERLLSERPEDRGSGSEALEALRTTTSSLEGGHFAVPESVWGFRRRLRRDPFVGRAAALDLLAAAYDQAASSRVPFVVHVTGASGIGKTTLVRHFLEQVASGSDFILLRGRCHLSERVPFCAIDGVVDDLVRALSHRDGKQPPRLSPLVASCVERLFPVLSALVQREQTVGAIPLDGAELRLAGFQGLAEIFRWFGSERRIVLWIDDLQWTDADSTDLLTNLLSADALRGALLVLSYRTDEELPRELDVLRSGLRPSEPNAGWRVRHLEIELGPMQRAEIESLLAQWLPADSHLGGEGLAKLAASAGGFPIFARELAYRALRGTEDPSEDGVSGHPVEDLINQRIAELPAIERRVIDAVAMCPGYVSSGVIAAAIGEPILTDHVPALVDRAILREGAGRDSLRLAPYHDSIREARLRLLRREDRALIHRELAGALEELEPINFEALTYHWDYVGEASRSADYAVQAADRAFQNLAFASAISYYRHALDRGPNARSVGDVTARLAESYASLGLGEEAARTFEDAARLAADEESVRPVDLRRRAAAEYLHTGRIVDGYRVMRGLMQRWGTRLPSSFWGCIARSALARVRLMARGTQFEERDSDLLAPEDVVRADTLWTACTGLAHVNHALADVFLQEHLVSVLGLGEPARVMRALTYEAAAEATYGGAYFDRRSDRLLAQAEEILGRVPSPYNRGWYWVARASRETFRSKWREVVECCQRAEENLRLQAFGVQWERAVNYTYWTLALAMLGDVKTLAVVHEQAVDEARKRRDLLAENGCCSGHPAEIWLFRDDAVRAHTAVEGALGADRWRDDALRRTAWPEDSFRTPDYYNLVAFAELRLYEGRSPAALARMFSDWPHLRRALLLQVQFVGVDLRFLLAKCALAVHRVQTAERQDHSAAPSELGWANDHLARTAKRQARALRRNANRLGGPLAEVVVAALPETDRGERRARLRDAARAFEDLGMAAYSAAARYRLGEALGPDGRGIMDDAEGLLADLGVVAPTKAVEFLMPPLN